MEINRDLSQMMKGICPRCPTGTKRDLRMDHEPEKWSITCVRCGFRVEHLLPLFPKKGKA